MKHFEQIIGSFIKRTFIQDDVEKQLALKYEKKWLKQNQSIKLKSEYDYILASTIFQSMENKEILEDAYALVRESLSEFWNTLDYIERRRIVNIDMEKTLKKLKKFNYHRRDKEVLIAFFDEKMNDIYASEMVMFELKQYRSLMFEYKDLIQSFDLYNYDILDGNFVPTKLVLRTDDSTVLYNTSLYKFFVVKDDLIRSYPIFDSLCSSKEISNEILFALAQSLVSEDFHKFMLECKAFRLISDKCYNKILKIMDRKPLFGK